MKELAGIELEQSPEIRKDPIKTVFSGFIKVRCMNVDVYKELCKKIRYFYIDGKECRALGHDENFKGNTTVPDET